MFTGIIIFCIFIIIIYGVILNIQFSDNIDFLSDLYLDKNIKRSYNKAKIEIVKKMKLIFNLKNSGHRQSYSDSNERYNV